MKAGHFNQHMGRSPIAPENAIYPEIASGIYGVHYFDGAGLSGMARHRIGHRILLAGSICWRGALPQIV